MFYFLNDKCDICLSNINICFYIFMMRYLYIITIAFSFVLYGCSPAAVVHELDRAEREMIDNPDSAELILNSIPRNQLNSRALKARFALLYSQALDKCYIDTDNDSLIRVAVDYYSRRGSDHEKAKAYYYESVVYRNAKDIDSQVKSLVKAHEFAHKTTDAYLEGLIHNKLGQLYHSQKQFDKALISHQRAV